MKHSRSNRFLACLLVVSGNIHAQQNTERASLCSATEIAYFSCDLKDRRTITLCAEESATGFDGRRLLIDYPKSAYKSTLQLGAEGFSYNQYSRYQVEYLNISTSQNGAEYRIFRNYDGSISKDYQYGVIEVSSGGDEKEYECKGSALGMV